MYFDQHCTVEFLYELEEKSYYFSVLYDRCNGNFIVLLWKHWPMGLLFWICIVITFLLISPKAILQRHCAWVQEGTP